MADDGERRDEAENDGQRDQPESEREAVRDRTDEAEPMRGDPGDRLGDLDDALETHDYPATTEGLVAAYGDYEVETQGGEASVEEVLARTDDQTYDSADDIRRRILGLIHR